MMAVFEIVLYVLSVGVLIPSGVFGLECLLSLLPRCRPAITVNRPRLAVLIPAHNEQAMIGSTLSGLMSQLAEGDRVIVVADNCTDQTPVVARDMGAQVIERHHETERGKGFAMAFGVEHLKDNPPEVVVFVDADCHMPSAALTTLSKWASQRERPVQALYLMELPANPGLRDQVSALAFIVKNHVRPRGLANIGMPCLLTGTGMAWPWKSVDKVELATGNIVEDMQLGLELALAGYPPLFCDTVTVTGCLPQRQQAASSQRTRWEHGHIQTLLNTVPSLLVQGVTSRRIGLIVLAMDLMVPPLSLLVMLVIVVGALCVIGGAAGISWSPTILIAFAMVSVMIGVLVGWAKFARHTIPFSSLLAVPLYLLWKIPIYVAFFVRRQSRWLRTQRDDES